MQGYGSQRFHQGCLSCEFQLKLVARIIGISPGRDQNHVRRGVRKTPEWGFIFVFPSKIPRGPSTDLQIKTVRGRMRVQRTLARKGCRCPRPPRDRRCPAIDLEGAGWVRLFKTSGPVERRKQRGQSHEFNTFWAVKLTVPFL